MNISTSTSGSTSLIERLAQERDRKEEQLASGKRINRAADDPAGLQISSRLTSQENEAIVRNFNAQDQRNINDVQLGRLSSINEGLQRASQLSIQSANALSDPNAIQGELSQITEQVNALAEEALGQSNFLSGLDANNPQATQAALEQAFEQVNELASNLGAESNALDSQSAVYQTTQVNVASANSRIADTDFAEVSSEREQREVLLQAAIITEKDEESRKGLLINQLI